MRTAARAIVPCTLSRGHLPQLFELRTLNLLHFEGLSFGQYGIDHPQHLWQLHGPLLQDCATLRWIKQLLSENANETDATEVQRREVRLLRQAYATPEHHDAVAAFLGKSG